MEPNGLKIKVGKEVGYGESMNNDRVWNEIQNLHTGELDAYDLTPEQKIEFLFFNLLN